MGTFSHPRELFALFASSKRPWVKACGVGNGENESS